MTRTVLFDLFGVIARHQSQAGKDRLTATAGVPAPTFWETYWALRPPYDRGEVTGPDYWHQAAHDLGTRFGDRQIADLIDADIASWNAVDHDMVALVEELAASSRPIALLSNIPEELAVHYEEHHLWLRHFQMRAFSCRIGHAKPEPGTYRWCHRVLGLEPDRILFVDDREENIQAAEATGMHGHLFTTPTRLKETLAQQDATEPA
ncbi:MAG TPA: HAD family phosphatase [Streptosporangiaceae bacterium]|nr:HAD family phosphatase [Streptosporangiaceae bacterium]